MTYDKNNVFAKILHGEIPNDTVLENDYVLAFRDINPKSDHHVVVIPKGEYSDFIDFTSNASENEIIEFYKAISKIVKDLGLEQGCQLWNNCGEKGGQEVPHFHFHILSGAPISLAK